MSYNPKYFLSRDIELKNKIGINEVESNKKSTLKELKSIFEDKNTDSYRMAASKQQSHQNRSLSSKPFFSLQKFADYTINDYFKDNILHNEEIDKQADSQEIVDQLYNHIMNNDDNSGFNNLSRFATKQQIEEILNLILTEHSKWSDLHRKQNSFDSEKVEDILVSFLYVECEKKRDLYKKFHLMKFLESMISFEKFKNMIKNKKIQNLLSTKEMRIKFMEICYDTSAIFMCDLMHEYEYYKFYTIKSLQKIPKEYQKPTIIRKNIELNLDEHKRNINIESIPGILENREIDSKAANYDLKKFDENNLDLYVAAFKKHEIDFPESLSNRLYPKEIMRIKILIQKFLETILECPKTNQSSVKKIQTSPKSVKINFFRILDHMIGLTNEILGLDKVLCPRLKEMQLYIVEILFKFPNIFLSTEFDNRYCKFSKLFRFLVVTFLTKKTVLSTDINELVGDDFLHDMIVYTMNNIICSMNINYKRFLASKEKNKIFYTSLLR